MSFHLVDTFLVHGILSLNEKWLYYILRSLEEQMRLFLRISSAPLGNILDSTLKQAITACLSKLLIYNPST
jgi:hypothetical protein